MSKKPLILLAPQHAAGRLKLSVSRLRQLEAMGELRAVRDSAGRRLYHAADIDELIAKREVRRRERERQLPTNAEPRPAA